MRYKRGLLHPTINNRYFSLRHKTGQNYSKQKEYYQQNVFFFSFFLIRENRFICHEQDDTVIENKLLIVLHLFERLNVVAGNFAKPEMTSIR